MNTFVNQITLRNFSLLFLPFFFCLFSNAQEKETEEKTSTNHEVRLDVFHLIVLPGIDVSYEHFIDNLSSWGVTGFLNFDNAFSEGYRYEQFEISPYYRLYYGRKNTHNSGFFVQHSSALLQENIIIMKYIIRIIYLPIFPITVKKTFLEWPEEPLLDVNG